MKYVQSFYQYPVTFSSIGKTFPAKNAVGEQRNLAEVTDRELEKLQNAEPFFRELVDTKKYRILNHMPESYKSSAARINEANDEIARLKAENERLKAQAKATAEDEKKADGTEPKTTEEAVEAKKYEDMTYAELQKEAKKAGIEYKNVKKAELIKALNDFVNQ